MFILPCGSPKIIADNIFEFPNACPGDFGEVDETRGDLEAEVLDEDDP